MTEKSMKILFIMPLQTPFDSAVRWERINGIYRLAVKHLSPCYPTGALSIGAYLNKFYPAAEIKIFDANSFILRMNGKDFAAPFTRSEFFAACFDKIGRFSPDIIGFTCLFNGTYNDLKPFAAAARKYFSEALIVAGGHLAAAVPDRIFSEETAVKAVCFGEGEIPFLNLCRAFMEDRTDEYLGNAVSWITAEKQAAGFVPRRELVQDLSEIPPFNLHSLVFLDEFLTPHPCLYLKEERKRAKEIIMFPTRGCPYHCIFCASQNVHGHKVRADRLENVKKEILYYNKEYGVTSFVFFDDFFLFDKKAAIGLLDFCSEHGWLAEIPNPAFYSVDEDIAAAMARAGIKSCMVNIENGNQETLTNIIHKPSNLKRAEQTVASLRKHGIMPIATILLGFPGETVASMMKGISYLRTTDFGWYIIWIVTPLPGSELWDTCIKNGYYSGELNYSNCETPVIHTKDFSTNMIDYLFYSYNKWLNFENNIYYRAGNYKKALEYFEDMAKAMWGISFLHCYYMALCAKKIKDDAKFRKYKEEFEASAGDEAEASVTHRKWIEKELEPL